MRFEERLAAEQQRMADTERRRAEQAALRERRRRQAIEAARTMLPEVGEAIGFLKANRVASERQLAADANAYTGVRAAVETPAPATRKGFCRRNPPSEPVFEGWTVSIATTAPERIFNLFVSSEGLAEVRLSIEDQRSPPPMSLEGFADAGMFEYSVQITEGCWEKREAFAADGLRAFAQRIAAHLAQVRSVAS